MADTMPTAVVHGVCCVATASHHRCLLELTKGCVAACALISIALGWIQLAQVLGSFYCVQPLQGIGKLEAIWAPSPSVDSQTYKEMFGPGSSDSSDGEDDAPLLTPRSSRLLPKASSSPISSGKDSQTSFESFRPSVDDSDPSPPLKSSAVAKGGSRHSSNGGDSPYSSEPWPLTGGMPPSNPALLASSALLSLRWRYRHGSCSSLSTMDSDESSPEASQGLQTAQLLTPRLDKPKLLGREEVLEEHCGYGHSSSGEDSPASSALWPLIEESLATSPAAAVLASPASVKPRQARGMTKFLRWRYRHGSGSCSSLSTMGSDESSPEASQGLQTAQLLTPRSDKPKLLSPEEVLEEHQGYGRSSSGEDIPPSSALWPLIEESLATSPAAAVLASPASVKPRQARGMTRFLRWRYRHGSSSCSSLSTMDSDESSPEASQRLQSAQLPSPPSANPKPLSRQEVQEERWGCGRSSCSDDDTDIDVSAVFGGTIGSGATINPTVTAMLSSSTASQLGSLQPGSAFSVGELDVAAFRLSFDFSSPVSLASVKLQCPVPGSGISPPWKLSPASPEAGSHTSSGTATIMIAGSAPLPSAEPMLSVTQGNTTDSRLSVTPANRSSNSSASVSSLSTGSALRGIRSPATAASMAKSSGSAGDNRHSRGSIGSSATGRSSLSGSQSRRPSWSIARPTSPAVSVTAQLPPALAKAAPLTRTSTPPACQPAFQRASTGGAAAKFGTRVPELAAGVMTRRQAAAAAAAAAHNGAKLASDVGAVPTKRPRQARSLKPEAPTRRQPERAARPQWR